MTIEDAIGRLQIERVFLEINGGSQTVADGRNLIFTNLSSAPPKARFINREKGENCRTGTSRVFVVVMETLMVAIKKESCHLEQAEKVNTSAVLIAEVA